MEQQHTSTEITTFLTDFCKDISGMMMDYLLHGENPKEIWVECEVHDVSPCEECQEWDCYGCEYKGGDAID